MQKINQNVNIPSSCKYNCLSRLNWSDVASSLYYSLSRTASIQKFQTSLLLNTITTYYSYQDYTDCFDINSILMCKILKTRSQGWCDHNQTHVWTASMQMKAQAPTTKIPHASVYPVDEWTEIMQT